MARYAQFFIYPYLGVRNRGISASHMRVDMSQLNKANIIYSIFRTIVRTQCIVRRGKFGFKIKVS